MQSLYKMASIIPWDNILEEVGLLGNNVFHRWLHKCKDDIVCKLILLKSVDQRKKIRANDACSPAPHLHLLNDHVGEDSTPATMPPDCMVLSVSGGSRGLALHQSELSCAEIMPPSRAFTLYNCPATKAPLSPSPLSCLRWKMRETNQSTRVRFSVIR